MPAPDPYPAPSAAGPMPDTGEAPPMGAPQPDDTEGMGDETAADDQEEQDEPLKNHLYLPGDFPGDKEPKPGDKRSFMVDAEFVEIKNGEQCWKETTVDGVPVSDEGQQDETESADENESTTDEAQGDEEAGAPPDEGGPPGGGKDFTAIIMGRKK